MWKAARSTHPVAWERVMLTINELNIDAYKYMIVTSKVLPLSYQTFLQIPDCHTSKY